MGPKNIQFTRRRYALFEQLVEIVQYSVEFQQNDRQEKLIHLTVDPHRELDQKD
jgi:hypothetical protein